MERVLTTKQILSPESGSITPWISIEDSDRSVKSAERTLAIFELFALTQRAMSMSEICEGLGLPQPSASMLLKNLVKLGYLERDRDSRAFIPTVRIMMLGDWVQRRFSDYGRLEKTLKSLAEDLCETALLGIQNSYYSQYIAVQHPDESIGLEVQSGLLRPITSTAVGLALLSEKPDKEVLSILQRCNAEAGGDWPKHRPAEFLEQMETIRRLGWSESFPPVTPNRKVFATTLRSPLSSVPMALGIGGEMGQIMEKKERVIAALLDLHKRSMAGPPR